MDQSQHTQSPNSQRTRWNMEVVIGIVLILVAIMAIVASNNFPSTGLATDIGSARFPQIFSGFIIVLSLILIWQALHPQEKSQEEKTPEEEAMEALAKLSAEENGDVAEAKEKPMYWRTAVGIIASFVCLAMINWFGYLLSVTPFMAFLMALLGMRHKILNPLIAIGITGILYFTFSVGLNVPLPVGSFFE